MELYSSAIAFFIFLTRLETKYSVTREVIPSAIAEIAKNTMSAPSARKGLTIKTMPNAVISTEKNQIQPPGGNAEPTVIQRVLNQKEVAHDKNDPEDKRECRSDLRRTGQKENAEQDLDGAFDKPKGFVTVNEIIDDAEQSPREHDTAEKITDRHLCHRGNHQQADSEHNIEYRFDKGSYL